ncbi:MAG: hypothetical protein ACREJX_15635, partial [Polyangiaceae bacterium]
HAQVVIPDAVWAKLHPLPVQRVFFLWHDPAKSAVASTGQMDLAWQDVRDVVVDAHGNLYFLGGRNESVFMSEQLTIWSTDASLALRWVREKIHFEMDDATQARLAIAPSGFLVLYVNAGLFNGRHSAMVLSCADGTTAATLGGVEPDDATAHHFDLKYVGSLTCDVDGTLLGLLHNRLLRWTHDGKPLETWPPKRGIFGEQHQKLRPLFYRDEKGERHALYADEKYPPGVDEIKDRPTEISSDSSTCLVGPDGALYLQNDEHLAKLDRAGTVLYRASLPEKGSNRGRPCADGYGNLYVIRSTARTKTHSIFRVSPDGRDTRVVVDGSAIGTPISDADVLAVLPDGTMVVFADEASVRIFGADGRARFLSEKARKDDADAARERAREDE